MVKNIGVSNRLATFHPKSIRTHAAPIIRANVESLIDGFVDERAADMRTRFANRLSILTIAAILGLPAQDESRIRDWYNAFAAALANFLGDPAVRQRGLQAAREFREYAFCVIQNNG